MLASISASAQMSYSRYDVNNDHQVNVTDVTKLVNIILGTETSTRGDVNGDEAVNVNDVTTLVDYILGKRVINGHEFVDLGLPSGTLWATQNVGASTTEQAGEYFAWGELTPKENFTWANYILCDGSSKNLKRYNADPANGAVDNLLELTPEDDAAHMQWGGLWRMPSMAQAQELQQSCSWALDKQRAGYVVTGPNGNSIFLPSAGFIVNSNLQMGGTSGYYWTTTLDPEYSSYAYCLVGEQTLFDHFAPRYSGRSIRPVAK